MSFLKRALAPGLAAFALAVCLTTAPAFADEREAPRAPAGEAPAPPSTAEASIGRLHGWDASLRGGYGGVYTVGISYVGAGAGAAIGYHLTRHLRLEAIALSSWGTGTSARNATLAYRSSADSSRVALGAGYDFGIGPLVIRPGARVGAELVETHTTVGTAKVRDDHGYALVGPCLAFVFRIGYAEFGVDGEAFFVPTWPASPVAGVYAFAGVHF